MTIRKRQNAGRSIRFKWTYVRVREGKGSDLFVFAGSGIRLGVAKNEKRRKQNPCIDFACQSRIRSRGSVFVQRGNGLKSWRSSPFLSGRGSFEFFDSRLDLAKLFVDISRANEVPLSRIDQTKVFQIRGESLK